MTYAPEIKFNTLVSDVYFWFRFQLRGWFWERNRHIMYLRVEKARSASRSWFLIMRPNPRIHIGILYQILGKSNNLRLSYCGLTIFNIAAVTRLEFGR